MKVIFGLQQKMKPFVSAMLAWGLPVLLMQGIAGGTLAHAAATIEDTTIEADCATLLVQADTRRKLQLVRAQLQSQGMKLAIQGCPFVRVEPQKMQQVLDVRVEVTNSDVASDFVRGPLADGQEVDMGDVQITLPLLVQGPVQGREEEVSPDVAYNRQWLSRMMTSKGLHAVGSHWWAFVPEAPAK